jgi:peptide-methionine (S)-S-oxide reductase
MPSRSPINGRNSNPKKSLLPFIAAGSLCIGIAAWAISSADHASFIPNAYGAEGIKIPEHKAAVAEGPGTQTAIFAGGCFWGVEGVFEHVKGVSRAESGYIGGTKAHATYDQVSDGKTGHAEAVRVIYNPKVISYNRLMQIFFSVAHDPTQLNRQGPDTGRQYRSAIYPVTKSQTAAAKSYITQLSAKSPWGKKPVTRIESGTFYAAEIIKISWPTIQPILISKPMMCPKSVT